MIHEMTRGDLLPELEIVIADSAGDADFSSLTANACYLVAEMDGIEVIDAVFDSIAVAQDLKSATLKRAWVAGETDTVGRMYLSVRVNWPGGVPQTFPEGAPLRLDIRRAAGDA